MIATCVSVRGSDLTDHQQGRFSDFESTYSLTVGQNYVVLAMGVWETVLHVLVPDDDGGPMWCPIGLFDVDPQQIPDGWEFSLDEGVRASGRDLWTKWVARWGYPEIVRDSRHSDALLERDPAAVGIFLKELQRRNGDPTVAS